METDDPLAALFDQQGKTFEAPGTALVAPEETPAPFREGGPMPDLTPVMEDLDSHPHNKQTDMIGQALRSALGIGALALIPGLIDDLRRTKDPDSRLKFLSLAFKEGGYGVKEDKGANMPTFHFNFVGDGIGQTVTVVQEAPRDAIEDATYTTAPPELPATPVVVAATPDIDPELADLDNLFGQIDG
jgi:hypothetical protein